MTAPRRPWTLALAGSVALAGVGLAVFPRLAPLLPPCRLHEATGLHCPGCGGTRCLRALADGNLDAALNSNLLLVGLGLVAALLLLLLCLREWTGRPRLPGVRSWHAWLLVGLVVGFGILRNLPQWPFHLLAPH